MSKTGKGSALRKQEFLAFLAEGYGVLASAKRAGFSTGSYYNWRKKDEAFRVAADNILSDPIHRDRILNKVAKADVKPGADWKDQFLALYRRTGDRSSSAAKVGKQPMDVEAALDEDSDEYDEYFAYRFQEEQQRKLWKIEDNTIRKAEHDPPTARFVLSNLMKEKYGKVGGEVTVNQLHWYSERGASKARNLLSDLLGEEGRPEVLPRPATGSE